MESEGDLFIVADRSSHERVIGHARNDGSTSPQSHLRPGVVYTSGSLTDSFTGDTPSCGTSINGEPYDDSLIWFKLPKNGDTLAREPSSFGTMEDKNDSLPRNVTKRLNKSQNSADPIVAVVGATGAGKSSFIDLLGGINNLGDRPKTDDGLAPCTKNITWYNATINGQPIQLLDTPGFDDTTLTDSEILEALSIQLAQIHKDKRPLNGIIYLYDISHHRLGGQSTNNLMKFQQLVGDDSLKNVVLVTTNWNPSDQIQVKREEQLETIYWKTMSLYGSRIERHDGSKESATQIVQSLISKPPTVIKIVDELVHQGLRWDETAVGKSMSEALEALRARMQEDITKLTTHLERLEAMRVAEAEQAQRRQDELVDRYAKETQKNNKQAVEEMADLKRQLKSEQEDRNTVQQAKEKAAQEEKRILMEKLDMVTSQLDRMKRKMDETGGNPSQQQSNNVPPEKTLYFRYPGYLILDGIAWLSWAIMTFFDIVMWVNGWIMTMKGSVPLEGTLLGWPITSVLWVIGHVMFNRTFFNSRGAENHGLFLLFINLAFRMLQLNTLQEDNKDDREIGAVMFWCVVVISFRYAYGSS